LISFDSKNLKIKEAALMCCFLVLIGLIGCNYF